MSTTRTEYRCAACNGDEVKLFMSGFVDANGDHSQVEDPALAELYPAWTWCEVCQDHTQLECRDVTDHGEWLDCTDWILWSAGQTGFVLTHTYGYHVAGGNRRWKKAAL